MALSAYAADHYLDIRKWKRVKCQVPTQDAAIDLNLRARTRPPPIGCMEWPGGRVLLQWALDVADLGANTSGTVLEIGSGIGLTAIGLALAREQSGSAQPQPVLATDVCDASLKLLSDNAAAHQLDTSALHVSHWDAAGGETALASLPIPVEQIDHVIGSDCVYHGFGSSSDASGHGLEKTLAALLTARPSLRIHLLVVNRFSGGAVAALSGAAGVNATSASTAVDPAIANFVRECEARGLEVSHEPIPPRVLERVAQSRGLLARAYYWLVDYDEGLSMMTVTPTRGAAPPAAQSSSTAPDVGRPRVRTCCACHETRTARDECIVKNGEAACAALSEAHKACLRAEGLAV